VLTLRCPKMLAIGSRYSVRSVRVAVVEVQECPTRSSLSSVNQMSASTLVQPAAIAA
jgi:hypothetical protein